MKRKRSLTEVQLAPALSGPLPSSPNAPAQPAFTVRLLEGAAVSIPAGFDPEELLSLLVVVREALA